MRCVSWCSEGTGHVDENSRVDQWCESEISSVPLELEDVRLEGEYFYTTEIGVSARRGWRQNPCVTLRVDAEGRHPGIDTSFDLTVDEAREIAELLIFHADLVEGK
ncbi:DUF6907 domain-containing protein [Gordonia oryzae]|uniref:DUF6907 domain-containing protein n=1 Tax=Gordonia oryzae TaxID=2487349 RepID=UPI003CCC8E0C